MNIIKTGLGLRKTIRNVGRLREIVTVLARNGFDELLQKSGILKFIPGFVLPSSVGKLKLEISEKDQTDLREIIGRRLRISFEELGPSFIKLGQLLATREDIFGAGFVAQMRLLQDKVKGVPFETVLAKIEANFGKDWKEIFESIEEKPIGTASIGVVHRGVLKSGESVVIKVRRPNIRHIIDTDFEILLFLIEAIEKVSEDIKFLGISKLITDYSKGIQFELDFKIEALNNKKLKTNIDRHDKEKILYLPKIYEDYIGEDVLVMEELKGIPFSNIPKIMEHIDVVGPKLVSSLEIFIKNILQDGFFHADLHGGNFFYIEESQKIGIIDFGLVGMMSKKGRGHFVAILYSLLAQNYENLVYEFLEVAEYDKIPDIDQLVRDMKDNMAPFVGLTAQNLNVGLFTAALMRTLSDNRIYIPRDWFIIFRALTVMDGVGKSLELDFDVLDLTEKNLGTIVESFISKEAILEESTWVGRDLLSFFRIFPRHIRWWLKELSKNNYTPQVKLVGLDEKLTKLSDSISFLGMCLLSSFLVYSGVHILGDNPAFTLKTIPDFSWIFWSLGTVVFLRGLWLIR